MSLFIPPLSYKRNGSPSKWKCPAQQRTLNQGVEGGSSPPTHCPLKIVPDWHPGRVTQSSVSHPTLLTQERTGRERKDRSHTCCPPTNYTLLGVHLILGKTLRRQRPSHTRKCHRADTQQVCDAFGSQPTLRGHSIQPFPPLQLDRCKHLTAESSVINVTWLALTWLSFSQTIKVEILQLRKDWKEPLCSAVVWCELQSLRQAQFGFCLREGLANRQCGGRGKGRQLGGGKAAESWGQFSPWPSASPVQPFPESVAGSSPIHSRGEPQTLGADLAQTRSVTWPPWGDRYEWVPPGGERVKSLSPRPSFIFRTILIGNLASPLPTFSEVIRMLIYKKDVY